MDECIEAIEGTAMSVLKSLHEIFLSDRQDDTEYIRNVRAVMDAIRRYAQEDDTVLSDPEPVKLKLYRFAKTLWLENLKRDVGDGPNRAIETAANDRENEDYYDYYFDYIYNHGVYPR